MTDSGVTQNSKVQLGPISETPSAYTEEPSFVFLGGHAELRYEYEYKGSTRQGGIKFLGLRAYAFRAEDQCTAWHIEGAYDELVEIVNSDWLASLVEAGADGSASMNDIRHFLVYLDGSGAFEIAAKSYEWLEKPVGTRQLKWS